MERRFPHSELRYGELVRGPDGKVHYLKPLRVAMYRSVVERIRERTTAATQPSLYLCMESAEVWRKVFNEEAPSLGDLDCRFAGDYQRRFPEASLPAAESSAYAVPYGGCGRFRPLGGSWRLVFLRGFSQSPQQAC